MSKAKILWVDDQIDLLKSHIIFLNEKGYQLDSCTNGSDALDKISINRFDVILLDENMPGISGIETLKKIKKIDRNIKVIMITKSEEENIMEEAIGKEISDYLIKPVNPNQILLSLKKTLQNKKLIKDSNISEYQQEFRNLSLKMMDISSFDEWIKFYLEIIDWELKLSDIDDDTMMEILNNQKIEANSLFSKYIEKNYQSWFKNDNHPCLSHEILKKHLSISFIKNEALDNFFSNKHLVFTGTLSELSRDEAKYLAKTKGAKILSSISKKTDFLIAGEKAGSKIDKALQLGVKILSEKEFLKKINL